MLARTDILDRLDMGIVVVGEDGKLLFWNRWLRDRAAATSDQIDGGTLKNVFGDRLEPHLLKSIERVLCHGWAVRLSHALHPAPFPLRQPAKASRRGATSEDCEIKQAVDLTPVPLEGGSRGCLVEIKDVTEAVRREHSLRQQAKMANSANQAKSRFLASITHELRTPLHGILGYAELLSLEGGLTAAQSRRLDVMMAAGQHLLAMINSVLDMSQIEADQLELNPAPVDLSALIGVCLDVMRPAADTKGLALVRAPMGPLLVIADALRLRQLLLNLLGNAVKFTSHGKVEVRLYRLDAGVSFRLEVVDSGPGVRAVHRDKLFQTFERLNSESVSAIEGTGLGLAINARLAQLMGGRIGYDDNPDGGSIFWLELPVGREAFVPQTKAVALETPASTRKMRVLVADDEALNRSIAHEFLRDAGHEVVCVNDGAAAVETATAHDFDVILMDVRMPVMNGLEATRLIRNLPEPRCNVGVVAVTAQAFAEQIETCRRAGMDLHVAKPFKQAELLAALEAVVAARSGEADTANPLCAAVPENEPEQVLFDHATLQRVVKHLPAAVVARYLRNLTTNCAALLPKLRGPRPAEDEGSLVGDTHRLAGSAGFLGFQSITGAARDFELVADTDAPERPARADDLAGAIESSIPMMQRELELISATMVA